MQCLWSSLSPFTILSVYTSKPTTNSTNTTLPTTDSSLPSSGADINAQTEETQETALTLACCGGFRDVADLLIKAGADLELGASTPLMEAAQEGHRDLVE